LKKENESNSVVKPANIVSILRIPILLLIIIFYKHTLLVLFFLALAMLSDMLDGYIARRTKPTSFGALLDPVCDKVFFFALFLFLFISGELTFWQVILLLLRDIHAVMLFTLGAVMHERKRLLEQIKARTTGKITTVLQFAAVTWLFIGLEGFNYIVYVVALSSIITIAEYSLFFLKKVKAEGS
jgi:CDP-diacylglycerol--glycerol-3-phosphate 3-phosphatidyltransferase